MQQTLLLSRLALLNLRPVCVVTSLRCRPALPRHAWPGVPWWPFPSLQLTERWRPYFQARTEVRGVALSRTAVELVLKHYPLAQVGSLPLLPLLLWREGSLWVRSSSRGGTLAAAQSRGCTFCRAAV